MNPTAIDFINRGGEAAWKSPSVFVEPTLSCFAVQADPHCVRDLLTRYIDLPASELGFPVNVDAVFFNVAGQAGPGPHGAVPFVFFVFIDSVRRQPLPSSSDTHYSQQNRLPQPSIGLEGRLRERLFAVLVPAIRRNKPDPDEVVFFAPYVFASGSPGWRAEREIFGYPQQQGEVCIELDTASPANLSVQARGIKEFGRDRMSETHTFVSLTRTGLPSPLESMPVMGIRQVCAHLLKVDKVTAQSCGSMPVTRNPRWATCKLDAEFTRRVPLIARQPEPFRTRKDISLDELLSHPLSMLFLKQFRDIVHSDRACYQAILHAKLKASATPVVTDLGSFELELTDLDSIPIRRELGIAEKPVVARAFQLRIPSVAGEGTENREREETRPTLSIEAARVLSNPNWNPAGEPSAADALSRLPKYVERGGELVWRQPSRLEGAIIYGFGVPVPLDRQESLLNSCINGVIKNAQVTQGQGQDQDGRAREFKLTNAGLGMVMLLFVDYRRITSGTDDDERLGGVSYREFLALQLALRRDPDFPELNWYIPFIYLDADSPRVAGREIYGYPKQLGQIDIQPDRVNDGATQPPQSLELRATVIHDPADTEAQLATILEVSGPKSGAASVCKLYDQASDMFADLLGHIKGAGPLAGANPAPRDSDDGLDPDREGQVLLENAQLSNIGNVFLKEFRDCVDPRRTCYQAVCKTDTIPGRFRSGGRLDPRAFTIKVHRHTSEPLSEYLLGENPPACGQIEPTFAYWLDIDFDLTRGRVIANSFTPRSASADSSAAASAAAASTVRS